MIDVWNGWHEVLIPLAAFLALIVFIGFDAWTGDDTWRKNRNP